MSQVTGTTDTFSFGTGGGLREDLEDKIWDLFPEQTWALTNLDRTDATAAYHEWEKDVLIAATNIPQIEGNDASFTSITAPTRAGNYCQIWKKQFLVSGTLEAVKKAGRAKEAARQTVKQMRELKNDIEYTIVRNFASSAGGSATARSMASMESWLQTNINKATSTSGSSTPGFSGGTVAAPTDGSTTGAFTEQALVSAFSLAWTQGGNARIVLAGTSQKGVIDAFAGQGTRMINVAERKPLPIVGSANVYVSSYGIHTIILHRHVRSTVVLALDPDYWATAWLRNPFMEQLAKTGDGFKYHIIAEGTLVARNEKSSAKVVSCS
jgi:hypothetical protein